MPLDYYIILDFEATCQQEGLIRPQEIIEFPSIIISAEGLAEVSRFQRYLAPKHCPQLTKFCTELTGITQETVDRGISFEEALQAYSEWLTKNGCNGQNAIVVTCGDWDLRTMAPSQCQLSGVRVPSIFQRWINIKTEFARFYRVAKSGGLTRMLDRLKLDLEGRHHSGIDDCHNTARILVRMCQEGYRPNEQSIRRSTG
jgi:inhibitor of KinA sporulation pathway (predicted exonuclease)